MRSCNRAPKFGPVDDETKAKREMLGARIQQARIAAGFTVQQRFCEAVNVRPPTLHRWERGQNVPDAFNLYEIARVCGVSMEWLVTGASAASSDELERWKETPTGRSAPAEAVAFLASLPLLGHEPSVLFYDLAFVAWQNGLDREDAARAARATEIRH